MTTKNIKPLNETQADRWREADIEEIQPSEIMVDEDIPFESKTLLGHDGEIQAMCFNKDSSLLATSSADMTIRMWDPMTGEELHLLQGHEKGNGWLSQLNALAFSPASNILASGGGEGKIKIWDPTNGKCLHDISAHKSWIKAIAFSPNGKFLASASADESVSLWDTSTWEKLTVFSGHEGEVECLAFSPSGLLLATGGLHDSTIHIWNIREMKLNTSLHHDDSVNSLCFSIDDSILASASDDNTTCLWKPDTGELILTSSEHKWMAKKVAFSPNGNILVCGGASPAFRVINLDTNTGYAMDPTRSGFLVCFHLDIRFLILGEEDSSSLQIVNALNGQYIAGVSPDDYGEYIKCAAMSPNGKWLASGHRKGSVYLWDVEKLSSIVIEEDD